MKNVDDGADKIAQTKFDPLPERVQEALGELAGAAKEGLLALSVGVGLGVLTELMAEEVDDVVGPKGRHDVDRAAVRHGHQAGQVTLGGRRVPALDRGGHARSRAAVPQDHRLQAPRRPRAGRRARRRRQARCHEPIDHPAHHHRHDDRAGRYARVGHPTATAK